MISVVIDCTRMGEACQRRTSRRGTRTVPVTVMPIVEVHKDRCGGKVAVGHLPNEVGAHGKQYRYGQLRATAKPELKIEIPLG